MDPRRAGGLALAAGSGVLYGSINVLAKPLALHPLWGTFLLYAASALALSPFLRGVRILRADVPKVLAMGIMGGGVAPILLFFGLQEATSSDTGLLLALEMVATAAFAFLFLRERFHLRELGGLLCLLATAGLIAAASGGGASSTTPKGALLVAAAAVAWGVDNTVSARLAGAYRIPQLICVKGLIGAGCSALALAIVRPALPDAPPALGMMALGVVSVAVSSLAFYHALRRVGAGRTSALNIATTALVGAGGGALVLGERLGPVHGAALGLAMAGAWLLAHKANAVAPTAAAAPKDS